jgi:hypothetical protein
MEKKKLTPEEIVERLIESKKEAIREMEEFRKTSEFKDIILRLRTDNKVRKPRKKINV